MEYHPYTPAAGGICSVCQQPAMSPQHVFGYVAPTAANIVTAEMIAAANAPRAPAQAIAPEPTQAPAPTAPAVTASTPAPDAKPEPVQGVLAAATAQAAAAEALHRQQADALKAAGFIVNVPAVSEVMELPAQGDLIPAAEQTPAEQAEVQRMVAAVDLAFPVVGFIDPVAELEKMLTIVRRMPEHEKLAYPEKTRAAILAHEAGKGPDVSDEDLALAIFIQRTYATPLTEEELEAKATGRKKREPSDGTTKPKSKKATSSIDQLKSLGF